VENGNGLWNLERLLIHDNKRFAMNWNNLKIAWRNILRTKLFTAFNIFGLALGFAGFILAYLYVNRETSYDRWNPNYEHI